VIFQLFFWQFYLPEYWLLVLCRQPEQPIRNDCLDFEDRKGESDHVTRKAQNLQNTTNISHQIQKIIRSPISILNIRIQIEVYRHKFVLKRVLGPRRNLICQNFKLHIFTLLILTHIQKMWLVFELVNTYFRICKSRLHWIELAFLDFRYLFNHVVSILRRDKVLVVHHYLNLSVINVAFRPLKHLVELSLIIYIVNKTSFILIEFSSLLWNTRSVNDI